MALECAVPSEASGAGSAETLLDGRSLGLLLVSFSRGVPMVWCYTGKVYTTQPGVECSTVLGLV
jgi:hypothetical protein